MFSFFSPDYTVNLDLKNRKSSYLGDDVVEGTVYFDVKKQGYKCDEICLLFLGQEKTAVEWETSSGSGKNRTTKRHYAYNTRNVVRMPMTLEKFSGGINFNKKAYPFRFTLPSEMPPTIPRINQTNDDWAELLYTLKVVVTKPGMLWGQSTSGFDFPINIGGSRVNPQFQATGPARMEPNTFPVTTCCCFSKGTISVGAIGDKTLCSCEKDSLPVRFALGNNSTVEIKHVDVSIQACARWEVQGHARAHTWTVSQHVANTLEIEGVKELSKSAKERGEVTASDEDIFHKLEDGGGYKTQLDFRNERPSYYGSCFRIEHELMIGVLTPCCSTNPGLRAPLKLASIDPNDRVFPMAEARSLPEADKVDYAMSSITEISNSNVIYGGVAQEGNDEAPPAYEAPIMHGNDFASMLKEMKASMYDITIVDKYIAGGYPFIGSLTREQLGAIFAEVDDVYVNKEIADKLFAALKRPLKVADLLVVVSYLYTSTQKAEFLNQYLSKCSDADKGGKEMIKAHLSAVEIMLLGSLLD